MRFLVAALFNCYASKDIEVLTSNSKFFFFAILIVVVIVLAYISGGKFSVGSLTGDFTNESIRLKKENETLRAETLELKVKVAELKEDAALLANQLSELKTQPLAAFEKEVKTFVSNYGDIQINGLNLSCDTPETRKYRQMKRELTRLKAKAEQLNITKEYFDLFNNSFSGIVSHGSC